MKFFIGIKCDQNIFRVFKFITIPDLKMLCADIKTKDFLKRRKAVKATER
jgi:hypothetical protein